MNKQLMHVYWFKRGTGCWMSCSSNNWCFQEHVTAVDSSFVVSFGWLESPFDEGVGCNYA
ncbi:Uncharacterized protein APZ42_007961 [Daphnia magna]|uniref:Uncharacterized protein n=1 Tax=Daphnia magna TaxID=35525 RepID=A0A162BTJ2_9CRUS|nr:Uncharacterized protein APZ42_007961 [Daphnia magna]